jgi:hypothetical protein
LYKQKIIMKTKKTIADFTGNKLEENQKRAISGGDGEIIVIMPGHTTGISQGQGTTDTSALAIIIVDRFGNMEVVG